MYQYLLTHIKGVAAESVVLSILYSLDSKVSIVFLIHSLLIFLTVFSALDNKEEMKMEFESTEYLQVATKGMAAYRAPSLTQPHRARQAIRDAYEGKTNPLIGYYCGISTVPTARVMAQLGADVVWIDWEHSSCGVETMTTVRSLAIP